MTRIDGIDRSGYGADPTEYIFIFRKGRDTFQRGRKKKTKTKKILILIRKNVTRTKRKNLWNAEIPFSDDIIKNISSFCNLWGEQKWTEKMRICN